jgi:hypothetical protein
MNQDGNVKLTQEFHKQGDLVGISAVDDLSEVVGRGAERTSKLILE